MEDFLNFFKSVDFITEFNDLKKRIETIEKHLNTTVDPNLANNIQNIENIFTRLENEIVPNIQAASNQAIQAAQSAQSAELKTIEFSKIAQEASDTATSASHRVSEAVNEVLEIRKRFTFAADGMTSDITNLREKAEIFITILTRELNGISGQFVQFGKNIESEAKKIEDELNEAKSQISVPLNRMRHWIDKFPTLDLTVANIGKFIGWPGNIYNAFRNLVWGSYGGQDSVIEEVMEGFEEIGKEFGDFGNAIDRESTELQQRIAHSTQLIEVAFNEFMNAFYAPFFNLSFRLKGEEPPVPG